MAVTSADAIGADGVTRRRCGSTLRSVEGGPPRFFVGGGRSIGVVPGGGGSQIMVLRKRRQWLGVLASPGDEERVYNAYKSFEAKPNKK